MLLHIIAAVVLPLTVFSTLSLAAESAAAKTDAPVPGSASLAKFLHSTEGTYGWAPVKGTISYDFFPDGRLHIQGPDGEATMWEGKWKLTGDQLTLTNSDNKTSKTVTAKRDGKDLLLDGARYRRYRPE